MRSFVIATFAYLVACAPPGRSPSDDVDDEEVVCPADLPPPSDPCLADQCGNALGVGRPCTRGGGQCDVFSLFDGEAAICIPDFADNTVVHACSMPCDVDEDCGDGAVCATDPENPSSKGCSLFACEGR
ncbi:MAG: hypothetical protein FJ137_17505 [Deltaproteobacteria bacterium]|nr:hypothetical protein [Deltaproteobacteria bacterium]